MRSKSAPPPGASADPSPASGRGVKSEKKILLPSPILMGEGPGVGATERRIIGALIALTLFASSLPYLLGYFIVPPGATFIGTAYNIDDYCNYLSWLRQMGDGHFFLHNLFTTDPQKDLEFNVFFWLLGRLMALTHCSPQAALQVARVGGGVGLLWLLSRFYRHCLPENVPARLMALGFACVSSGFGWVVWSRWQDKNSPGSPVDAWQPEAYTFLSLYTSALMTVSTLLILGALYALLLGEQTGRWKYPVIAGICGGILGNMHSYDVLHLSAAWGLFLVVLTIMRRGKGVGQSWLRAAAALGLTLPTTLYMYYVFNAEAVFRKRANVPTLSPRLRFEFDGFQFALPFIPYIIAYGLVSVLAIAAIVLLLRRQKSPARDTEGGTPLPIVFAVCWAVGGLLVCYLPFAFQRKMLMGEHLPLCLLAGIGAAWLVQRLTPRMQPLALAGLVLASLPSSALFLVRDFKHLEYNRSETHLAPFLNNSLLDVYHWLRANTPENAAVVGFPGLCTYLPGEAGRAVWAGHWAETPSYGKKDAQFADAFDAAASSADREAFLHGTGAQYLFYPNDTSQATFKRHGEIHTFVPLTAAPPSYLTPVYKNNTFTVYRIQ